MKRGQTKVSANPKKGKANMIKINDRNPDEIFINRAYESLPKYNIAKAGEKAFQVYSGKGIARLQEKYPGCSISRV